MLNKRITEDVIDDTLLEYNDSVSIIPVTEFMVMLGKLHTYSLFSKDSIDIIFDHISGNDQDILLSFILTTINRLYMHGSSVNELRTHITSIMSELSNSGYHNKEFLYMSGIDSDVSDNVLSICMLYRLNMKQVKQVLKEIVYE